MQDEDIDDMDKLIREASNSHHPVYDDKAWEKMAALLDKHLPVKKDRRKRPVIFILLLLFITVAVSVTMLYQAGNRKTGVPGKSKPSLISLKTLTANKRTAERDPQTGDSKTGNDISKKYPEHQIEKLTRADLQKSLLPKRLAGLTENTATGVNGELADEKDVSIKTGKPLPGWNKDVNDYNNDPRPGSSNNGRNGRAASAVIPITAGASAGMVAQNGTVAPKPGSRKLTANPAGKNRFTDNFAVNISAGPDRSFVAWGDGSKTRLTYGIGLGYTFADRVTLRTGFYDTKKAYMAKASDYHPPSWYWTNSADLKKVYAQCNVYEIPVSVSYHFLKSNKHSWFAGVGFSSFIMKRETYNYTYKDTVGQTRYKSWTLLNGGNNYLSVLTISAGYQYRINPHFSILAEPYLKLPLSGIGFGNIKLNSAGFLLTASIKPFKKGK